MSSFYTNVYYHKSNILYIGYEHGNKVKKKIKYHPYLFVPSQKENAKFKDVHGQKYDRMDFDSVYESNEFIKKYENVANFELCGYRNHAYTFIYDHFRDMKFMMDLISVVTLDIEVASDDGFPEPGDALKEITAISMRRNDKIVVLGCGEYVEHREDITYIKCKDEVDLLKKFLTIWESKYFSPDIVTGWNVEFFDIPYLVNRINRILGWDSVQRMSPWGIVMENTVRISKDSNAQSFHMFGVAVIDYLQAYKKFSFKNQESYKLDHIAFVELQQKKIDYSEYGNLQELYMNNYQKFIEYNIMDVDLVHRLEEKLGFIAQIITIAYDSKINYEDAFTSVKMWDVIIHNHLRDKGVVVPLKQKHQHKTGQIVGAYVKDPQIGMHNWIASFDLNSLYPHLIMQYNISPETLYSYNPGFMNRYPLSDFINGDIDSDILDTMSKGYTYTPNGCFFRKDKQGFLPELMQQMYDDRVFYKQKMIEAKKENEKNPSDSLRNEIAHNHNMQLAKKIILNSAYGALSNEYFRWYSIALAEAVTMSGQLSIRWIEDRINEYINDILKTKNKDYVLASDTDSIYITFDPLVQKMNMNDKTKDEMIDFIDTVCREKIEPHIDDSYVRLANMMNAYQQKMFMKRECLADRGIWTAKKKYILNVYDEEGVRFTEPKLKIMGSEAVRSSTPMSCRDNIKKAFKLIMTSTQESVIEFVEKFREEFYAMPYEEIAFPRGVNNLDQYRDAASIYKKGTPIHVRGSLLHNKMIVDAGLENKYELIKTGSKIKFCYLKMPNPIHENVISCAGELPKEFDLEPYIDYELQFQKAFLDPLKNITEKINWELEKRATIDSFFS